MIEQEVVILLQNNLDVFWKSLKLFLHKKINSSYLLENTLIKEM